MKKNLTVLLVVLGIVLIGLGIYYFLTPAGSLPAFLPGHASGSTHKHLKHGLAALLLGLGLWVWAWFNSGPSSKDS
jgi:hypothetical protein